MFRACLSSIRIQRGARNHQQATVRGAASSSCCRRGAVGSDTVRVASQIKAAGAAWQAAWARLAKGDLRRPKETLNLVLGIARSFCRAHHVQVQGVPRKILWINDRGPRLHGGPARFSRRCWTPIFTSVVLLPPTPEPVNAGERRLMSVLWTEQVDRLVLLSCLLRMGCGSVRRMKLLLA